MPTLDRLACAVLSSALFAWVAGCSPPERSEQAQNIVKPAEPPPATPSVPPATVPSGVAPEQARRDPHTAAEQDTKPGPQAAAKSGTPARAKPSSSKSQPALAPPPPPPAPAAPDPVAPKSAPAAAFPPPAPAAATPAKKTVVRKTANVRVDVSAGMQSLLDADPRMQPWIDKVIAVADRCYANVRKQSASASGVIVVEVTMHANARPDADIKALPNELAGLVTCGTGELMRNRMPLFTGPEGQRHTLRMHFTP